MEGASVAHCSPAWCRQHQRFVNHSEFGFRKVGIWPWCWPRSPLHEGINSRPNRPLSPGQMSDARVGIPAGLTSGSSSGRCAALSSSPFYKAHYPGGSQTHCCFSSQQNLQNRCASQSHPQRALQGGNHHLITSLLAAWHLNREAAGKSEGCGRDEEHLYWTHQIPHSGWTFSLSFIWSIIYNIESELIWFQLDYWSSDLQQCFLCCTLAECGSAMLFFCSSAGEDHSHHLRSWEETSRRQATDPPAARAGGAVATHAWITVTSLRKEFRMEHVYNNSAALWLREGNLAVPRPVNTEGVNVV